MIFMESFWIKVIFGSKLFIGYIKINSIFHHSYMNIYIYDISKFYMISYMISNSLILRILMALAGLDWEKDGLGPEKSGEKVAFCCEDSLILKGKKWDINITH